MMKKPEIKVNLKKEKEKVQSELVSLKKSLLEYKKERKDDWKKFKKKMKDDLSKIEKSISKLK